MKKLLIISALTLAPAIASANPGCGLGAQVFEGKTGTANHVLAATTNGTSGNQTFGMTFGTLGCDTSEPVQFAALYINGNMERVAADMANGKGESLDALANLLDIEAADRAHFGALVKSKFDSIYASSTVSADEVFTALNQIMAADTRLARYAA